MQRGRSARGTHSDSSDRGAYGGQVETEVARLQRQLRVMEAERHAYRLQTQEHIRKQRLEMERLRKEQEELQNNLRVCERQSLRQTDSHDTQQIRALLKHCDELDEQVERERYSQPAIEREIQSRQKKLEELRKGVSTFHRQKSQTQHIQKATCTLENKLDQAHIRFNKQVEKNNQLRGELEMLRMDHARFQKMHHKLNKELQEIRQEIGEVVSRSIAAYSAREESHKDMRVMEEKEVVNQVQYSAEMNDMKRLIAHEQRLKDFMTTKCKKRTGLDNSLSRRHEMKMRQRSDSEVTMETLEEVFQQIKKVTGEDDLEMLVTKFIQGEDRNFALFDYVNEQNKEAEALKDQIRQIKEGIERFQAEDLQQEQEHHTSLKQMEKSQRDTEAQALEYKTKAMEITKTLDLIKTRVMDMFNKMDCKHEEVDDLPGTSAGIRDSNIMTYLRLLEQKTNKLLTVQAFIKFKEQDCDPKSVAQLLLGQNAKMQSQVVQPHVSVDVDDMEESLPHEEDRPLTREELFQFIKYKIARKERAQQARKSKKARSAKSN